jgi:hypothetical protein
MKAGGTEMLPQPDDLVGTGYNAQFAGFAPLFINLYSWHINSLPGSLGKSKKFRAAQNNLINNVLSKYARSIFKARGFVTFFTNFSFICMRPDNLILFHRSRGSNHERSGRP